MSRLDDDIRAAGKMGITYGKYKSLTYRPENTQGHTDPQKRKSKRKQRRFTDNEAFQLWQAGYPDSKIGKTLGVSAALIQRWRDQLELPSTYKYDIDTKKYRLDFLRDGTAVVLREDDVI